MADIAWKDFVDTTLPPIVALDGTEKLAAIDSDGEPGSITTSLLADYASDMVGASPVESSIASVSAAEIQNSNTTPVILIANPGVGKIIDVMSLYIQKNFVSTAYDTNVNVTLGQSTFNSVTLNGMLGFAADEIERVPVDNSVSGSGLTATSNQPFTFRTNTGNPLNGDGTLKFFILYRIIDVA